jgi:hypothetical protein
MPMTVATPRVPKIQDYEVPFFKEPESPQFAKVGAEFEAGVQAGQQVQNASLGLLSTIKQRQNEIRNGEAVTFGAQSINEYDAKLTDAQKKISEKLTGTNAPEMSKEFETERQKIKKEIVDRLSSNPVSLQYFERHSLPLDRHHGTQFGTTVAAVTENTAIGELTQQTKVFSSASNVFNIFENADMMYDAAMQDTAIRPEHRQKIAESLRSTLIDTAFRTMLQDPKSGLVQAMNIPEFEKKLNERSGLGKMDEYKKLLNATGNKELETSVQQQVLLEAGGDFEKAESILIDQGATEKYGITSEQQDRILGRINHQWKSVQTQSQIVADKAGEGLIKLRQANQLDADSINTAAEQIKDPHIKRDFLATYTGALNQQESEIRTEARFAKSQNLEGRRLALEEKKERSNDVYAVLVQEAVTNPGSVTQAHIAKAISLGLDPSKVSNVLDISKKFNPELKKAIGEINDYAAKQIFSKNKEDNLKAKTKLINAVTELANSGMEGDKLYQAAQKLIEQEKKGFIMRLITKDVAKDIRR